MIITIMLIKPASSQYALSRSHCCDPQQRSGPRRGSPRSPCNGRLCEDYHKDDQDGHEDYEDYAQALEVTQLPTLDDRRTTLCKKFANNCVRNKKTSHMFPINQSPPNTRCPEKFFVQHARTDRLKDSAIPYMQRLLNSM